jgi:hypothetical protein
LLILPTHWLGWTQAFESRRDSVPELHRHHVAGATGDEELHRVVSWQARGVGLVRVRDGDERRDGVERAQFEAFALRVRGQEAWERGPPPRRVPHLNAASFRRTFA